MKTLLLALALIACGPRTAPKPTATPAASGLAIVEMTMTMASDTMRNLKLEGDGTLWASTYRVGKVTPNGEVRTPEGKLLASLAADGSITFDDEQEKLTVREDGTVIKAGETVLSFADDGSFTGPLGDQLRDAGVTLTGPPEGRRAVMLGWLSSTVMESAGLFQASPWGKCPAGGFPIRHEPPPENCTTRFESCCYGYQPDACKAAGCPETCTPVGSDPEQVTPCK